MPQPPVVPPEPIRPFPDGETVCRIYVIEEQLAGHPGFGRYRSSSPDGSKQLVALLRDMRGPLDRFRQALAYDGVDGIAPLLAVARLDDCPGYFALVESEPPGRPLTDVDREDLDGSDVLELAVRLAESLLRAQGRGDPIAYVPPELVYVRDDLTASAIVPRAPLFLRDSDAGRDTRPMLFPIEWWTPEHLRGTPVGGASTVFALCLLVAHLASGHPFAGVRPMEKVIAMGHSGERAEWTGDPRLGALLDPGLSLEPTARPPLALLVEQLRRLRQTS